MENSTTAESTPSIDITLLHLAHPLIRAQDWCAPLAFRLGNSMEYADGFATIVNSFRDFELSESQKEFTLRWQSIKEDFTKCLNTYQNPTLTEFAALGLACILLTNHTNLSITEVCYRGESVDYWLGNENDRKKYVLEVSGRSTGSIDDLCIEKTAQLKANPWKRGGFVCVIIFESSVTRLWFCKEGVVS